MRPRPNGPRKWTTACDLPRRIRSFNFAVGATPEVLNKVGAQSIRVGRFEFLDGSEATPANATLAAVKRDRVVQRLIGNFGFTDVGRSLDGVQYFAHHRSGHLHIRGRPAGARGLSDRWLGRAQHGSGLHRPECQLTPRARVRRTAGRSPGSRRATGTVCRWRW